LGTNQIQVQACAIVRSEGRLQQGNTSLLGLCPPRILDTGSIHNPEFFSNSVFLAEDVFLSIFFPTQPAPLKTGVIPAVLPVKGLR